ncbi:MAG TPA: FeoA family protein [Polyangiaceae bacterium]|nr:MAG: ferrous iron transport protein A [Deltaproteobacteria bacterium ADurb.Bin207]HNS98934.1 FeoA family protein [Polyangiaceae bacterium]HNZ23030.1 FeoA family protein [Polyangiaceae bacterium]HOD21193.1 FeoA family protein [Polyangiaceae bacterium]HOE49043.1 FeoA family protein [Polyangiaceae bacterium]
MTLDQMQDGLPFVIDTLHSQGELRRRLVDMGFIAGAEGTVLRRAPLGGPIELRIGRSRLALRLTEAQLVSVIPSHA